MSWAGGLNSCAILRPRSRRRTPWSAGWLSGCPAVSVHEQVVLADGALKVAAGGLLAFGRFPRLSALALAGSLVPTTIAGHPFWKESDPAKRRQQRVHLTKNVSMLGGLLIAAVDTEGKPSLAWRAGCAAHPKPSSMPPPTCAVTCSAPQRAPCASGWPAESSALAHSCGRWVDACWATPGP